VRLVGRGWCAPHDGACLPYAYPNSAVSPRKMYICTYHNFVGLGHPVGLTRTPLALGFLEDCRKAVKVYATQPVGPLYSTLFESHIVRTVVRSAFVPAR